MKHAGFTLIEVVVALGILALSIAGLLSLLTSSQNRIGKSMEEWKNMHMLAQAAEFTLIIRTRRDCRTNSETSSISFP